MQSPLTLATTTLAALRASGNAGTCVQRVLVYSGHLFLCSALSVAQEHLGWVGLISLRCDQAAGLEIPAALVWDVGPHCKCL